MENVIITFLLENNGVELAVLFRPAGLGFLFCRIGAVFAEKSGGKYLNLKVTNSD